MKIFNLFVLYRSNIHFAQSVYDPIQISRFVFVPEVPSTIPGSRLSWNA